MSVVIKKKEETIGFNKLQIGGFFSYIDSSELQLKISQNHRITIGTDNVFKVPNLEVEVKKIRNVSIDWE